MKAKRFAMAAALCLAAVSSSVTWSDPLVCVDFDGTRMEFCPAFFTVEDWGDICTIYHDGTNTLSFGCTEIVENEVLTCLQAGCTIREQDMGCEGSFFDDRPCEGHQDLVAELELFDLINEARVEAGLPEVHYHPIASNAEEAYAEFICARGGCDQETENCHRLDDGKSGGDRLEEAGIAFWYWCENIDWVVSPRTVFDRWMDSDRGHRDCILNDRVTDIGVAHVGCTNIALDVWLIIQFERRSAGLPSPIRPIGPSRPLPFKWYPLNVHPKLSAPPMDGGVKARINQLSLPTMESGTKGDSRR